MDLDLLAELGGDLDAYIAETSQWANPHMLEASVEAVFDAICFDLSGFGDDENLPPAPHTLVGGAL